MADKIYFTTTDPEGREICLTQDTWTHIKTGHPEFKHVSQVKTPIQKPDIITENTARQSLAYTKITRSDLYINVYAKMDDTYKKGKVSTAFRQSRMPKGDVIWHSKK